MFGVCVLQNCFVDARFMDRDVSYRPPRPSQETMQENKNTTLQLVAISYQEVLHGESSRLVHRQNKNEPAFLNEQSEDTHPK